MKENIKYCHIPDEGDLSFFFDHVHISCNEQISLHQQKTWELSYVICGKGMRVIGDTIEAFESDEIILIPPNIPHYWSFNENETDREGKIENITLTFSEKLLKDAKGAFDMLREPIHNIQQINNAISFSGETLRKLQKILLKMKHESEIERLSSLIKIFALISTPEIAATVGKPVVIDKRSQRLQKIYLFVMDNYQHNITLEQVAEHVGMEKTAFCVFFKKMTGNSFFTFLANYRINVACDMLIKTTKTIAEISIDAGFRDVPYFNRVFKELKKTTPGKYRLDPDSISV